jgi:hypothetical protein
MAIWKRKPKAKTVPEVPPKKQTKGYGAGDF